ncbi:hypothetical protein [Marinitoga aeolica]|uniref:Type II/III secretion system secretin-like domain-containing protein n=1 Tax=Marinitoga aeolica TaxID=2809031 RepID=A0ABY8PTT2_9BACT|nr:hypothetical protein [Marinitoga aeolica]WGS66010.1 hypothetical protein JRV97_05530 [Marinitoga aeolica]
MKKSFVVFFILLSSLFFAYDIKIDYLNNNNIIEITGVATDITIFKNNTKTNYKIKFNDVQFEKKTYILPRGPIKKINLYDNIIEIIMIFPGDIVINKNNKVIISAKGKKALNNETFKFKNIKIKDLLNLLLKELGFNQYYLTDIPDKTISLDLKNFYPEDLFRIILDSTGIYYNYISTKDIYISKSPLYNASYPIISSKKPLNINDDEIYISLQTNISNFNNLLSLIGLKYVKISDTLYVIKGSEDKIDLVKKIINTIPVQPKKQDKNIIKDSQKIIKNKIHKIFEYNLPQKDIINVFNIEYSEITNNLILLTGFEEDITLFEEFYNKAYETFQKLKANEKSTKSTIKTIEEKSKPIITEEPTYTIITSKYSLKNMDRFFNVNILNVDKDIYFISGLKKNISQLKSLNEQLNKFLIPTEEPTSIDIENDSTITVINTDIPLENLADTFDLKIKKVYDTIYIVKGKNVNELSNLISKIHQIKEMKINKNYNVKNLKNEEKIEIIHSNLDLLPFNKIFKDSIIQKIDKNYIIKGTENVINTIKDFNEKYDVKVTNEPTPIILPKKDYYFTVKNEEYAYFSIILKNLNIDYDNIYENDSGKIVKIHVYESEYMKLKELLSLKNDLKENVQKNKNTESLTLYSLVEQYAKNNNYALINDEKLKNITIYNPKDFNDIELLLTKNDYYLEKEKNVIIVKKRIPKIISIEIAIVDSSILEETIQKIEAKISSKSIIDSINQGIINPQLYKEILDTAFNVNDINSRSNAKLVSKPRIILKSGTKSTFKSVYRVPVVQENSIKYIESGLTLEIEANYVENMDLIDLDIDLKVGEPEKSTVSNYNAENSREINTKMILKNNFVSILGGLKIIKEENLNSGVPFLKDLPIVGFLFKSNEKRNREYDLNLFIWPKLVNYGGD